MIYLNLGLFTDFTIWLYNVISKFINICLYTRIISLFYCFNTGAGCMYFRRKKKKKKKDVEKKRTQGREMLYQFHRVRNVDRI